ncbi:MAG: cytochrome c3 family protein [Candidatus Solibacter usitatus]|nr:cytochrome c3 family protein [Candidatus Solibacter usitatus]
MTLRLLLTMAFAMAAMAAKDTCVECHTALGGELQAPVTAFAGDVHKRAGFSCADCHGGDRNSDDYEVSMSKGRGYLGKISRTDVPKLCARCHSDAALIHKFKPQQRVDQLAQYVTSVHGKRLAAGDTAVANCVDCHSVHDIRDVKDPLAPVYPTRVVETCTRCHADAAHMAKYKLPTNQRDEYRASVHWEALSKRKDLSAPTCASCHGNHGAAPPQVASVAAVCGTCHALQQDLYNNSPHKPAFDAMGVAGCVACHSNHAVHAPSEALLAGDKALCSQCHDADSAGGKTAAEMHTQLQSLADSLTRSNDIVARARRAGMEVSEAAMRLADGQERLVKARVAVHNFRTAAVAAPVKEGLAIAAETHRAGQDALAERDFRRVGLGVSLAAIFLTMAGLWLAIRSVEAKPPGSQTAGSDQP